MMNVLFNSARYTCEASNTLRKNKFVTGNGAQHHFTGKYILQFIQTTASQKRRKDHVCNNMLGTKMNIPVPHR